MQVVIVGCGGIFFHGVRLFGLALKQLEPSRVILVDPDAVEERNFARQWFGRQPGVHKTQLADAELLAVGIPAPRVHRLDQLLTADDGENTEVYRMLSRVESTLVICVPDNDRCRQSARRFCRRTTLSGQVGYLILGGCAEEHGKSVVEVFVGEATKTNPLRWNMAAEEDVAAGGCAYRQNALSNGVVGMLIADQVVQVARIDRILSAPNEDEVEGAAVFTNYGWRRTLEGGVDVFGDTYLVSKQGSQVTVELYPSSRRVRRRAGGPSRGGAGTAQVLVAEAASQDNQGDQEGATSAS